MQSIKAQLRQFKLSGMSQSLEVRLKYAKDNQLSYQDFLGILLDDEANNRQGNSYKKRYAKAKLPSHKSIEDFDFTFQPSIDKKLINDCLTCQFIRDKRNIVFIGNPGTGKTHLSIAIAMMALKKGYKVLFTTTAQLLHELHGAKADNSFNKRLNYYLAADLLVIDELGFKKIPNYSADDFFEIISRRYEHSSIIITTNKTFEQWGEIFADNILASAVLDRIVHYSEIFKINGQSYRQKDMKKLNNE